MPYIVRHPNSGFLEFRRTPEEQSLELLKESNEELRVANQQLASENEAMRADILEIKKLLNLN